MDAKVLQPGDLILCERSSRLISEIVPEVELSPIELSGLSIRDFPEVSCIYSLKATDSNYAAVIAAHQNSRDEKYGVLAKGRGRVAA